METNEEKRLADSTIIDEKLVDAAIKQIQDITPNEEGGVKDPERLAKFVEGYRGESVGRLIEDIISLLSLLPKGIRESIALTYLPMELKLLIALARR